MIPSITVPDWVKRNIISFQNIEDIPDEVFERIKQGLASKKAEDAFVTIGVIAYNEQENILSCLASLAEQETPFPLRIVVSNNNSTDQTQYLLDKCGAFSVFQPQQGIGYARQAAMDVARGKYFLCADADCMYPPTWAEEFAKTMDTPGVSAVYSVDSYIPSSKNRITLALYEFIRDISLVLRRINRPELSVGGGSFGIPMKEGNEIGWYTRIKRGEDGSMAFALKQHGKIKFINSSRSRIWTTSRSLDHQQSLFAMVTEKFRKEFKRIHVYLFPTRKGYKDREENIIK
ncbi:MAG: glycosyltransferase family 2 protein [Bacteroidales bacterium]|nr:glycosyltransferase family 2 protein [Bacteroidales bacterium]